MMIVLFKCAAIMQPVQRSARYVSGVELTGRCGLYAGPDTSIRLKELPSGLFTHLNVLLFYLESPEHDFQA